MLSSCKQQKLKENTEIVESKKPNIIFILTDDQRWDALGYAGNEIIETPEMDKLAKEGVYFKNAAVTTPICAASRASIFSGLQERTHKYNFGSKAMLDRFMDESYPAVLKEAGYYTGFYGKFGVKYNKQRELFDKIENYGRRNAHKDYRGYYFKTLGKDTVHLTRYTGQKALDFIDEVPADKPFSLSLSFNAPHAHDGAPEQYFWQEEPGKLYNNMDVPEAKFSDDKYFERLPEDVKAGYNRLRWEWRYETPEKYQHSVKGYYRMLKGVDLEIEKIRAKLEEKGIADNTVIILMGDNGYFLGERQLAGKWLMYDNSIRVPLIVFDPRVKEHKDIDGMALNIDVPATIVDLAGAKIPENWQGKSLMPVVNGTEKSLKRDTILIEHLWEKTEIPPSEGVRTAGWKYFRYVNDKSIEELYDLKNDPQEINNLVANEEYKQKLEEFRKKCDEMIVKLEDKHSGIPTNLSVDSNNEPAQTAIINVKPMFGWDLPEKTDSLNAFQVLVSSSRELASQNIGDVWNSKKVKIKNVKEVAYKGSALAPNKSYFWRIRTYDTNNRLSEYSEIQEFKTAKLAK
tara:strand:- start:9862 stop:11577 length:1716 start_codon:yes stop_codon:yes gene_type:complete